MESKSVEMMKNKELFLFLIIYICVRWIFRRERILERVAEETRILNFDEFEKGKRKKNFGSCTKIFLASKKVARGNGTRRVV